MNRIRSPIGWILYLGLALVVSQVSVPNFNIKIESLLVAQPPGISQRVLERVVFVETYRLQTARPRPDRTEGRDDLPEQITATEYSLDYARRGLVPSMGGSIAVGDFNADGHADLYAVVPGSSNHLLLNNGNGDFTDVTAKAHLAGNGSDLSATFADYDHSGYPSLFVAGLGGVVLYHNNGDGTFVDATRKAGLRFAPGELYTRAALSDVNSDGFPDLVVTAYTDLNAPPSKPVFLFPNDFCGISSYLYRNNGDGTFTDITASSGLIGNPGRTRNAVFADFNDDGFPDLLLLRDEKPPVMYLNRGGGKFEDWTSGAGEPIQRSAFFDAQVADFDHDGKLDLALWSTLGNRVLLNKQDGGFKLLDSTPLIAAPPSPFGFHGTVADFNGDGFDDLLALDRTGHWRLLVNQAGQFHEAAFTALNAKSVAGQKDVSNGRNSLGQLDSVRVAQLENHGSPYLIGLGSDGQIAVFKRNY